jgi:hypothetical protein
MLVSILAGKVPRLGTDELLSNLVVAWLLWADSFPQICPKDIIV